MGISLGRLCRKASQHTCLLLFIRPSRHQVSQLCIVWGSETDSSIAENNGSYLQDCTISKQEDVRSWARDPIEAEQLWKLTEEIVGEKFEYWK